MNPLFNVIISLSKYIGLHISFNICISGDIHILDRLDLRGPLFIPIKHYQPYKYSFVSVEVLETFLVSLGKIFGIIFTYLPSLKFPNFS